MNIVNSSTLDCSTSIPSYVDEKHWDEWIRSAVRPSIISLNVRSIHDPREADRLLNRNNNARWKHSNEMVPSWAVSGVDPLTGEPTLIGCQVKPDTSILNDKGKIQKYFSASGYSSAPLFLNTGHEDYWKSVINDKSRPIVLTEGAKKAGVGLSIDYPTISIPGVSTCRKNGRLHDSLNLFAGFGRIFYLCFDNDVTYKKNVGKALISMARELSAAGSKVMVITIPVGEEKGMDDFISRHGKDEFKKLVDSALTIEEWRETIEKKWEEGGIGQGRKSRLNKFIEIVRDGWGDSLRLNLLKNQIELEDNFLDLDKVRLRIALEFDQDVPLRDSQLIVETLAEQNAYHPVLEYLDYVALRFPKIDVSILDNLATRYFGSTDEMHNIFMKKTLIAAVARVREPGCKHDCATILVGKQGIRKSTFWRYLFGEDWFTDELGDASEKDELMKLHRFWGLEWAEFETVYKRKDIESLKKFMSSTTDAFRVPYSRTISECKRSCVLVGTTNELEILTDPTGNRRFWIIPVDQEIPVDILRQERDKLWAAANALYEMGQSWWLNTQQADYLHTLNQNFRARDPWEEIIELYLKTREYVTTQQILLHIGVEPSRQDIRATKRVSAILRALQWKQARKRVGGQPLRVWIPQEDCGSSPTREYVDNQYVDHQYVDHQRNCSQLESQQASQQTLHLRENQNNSPAQKYARSLPGSPSAPITASLAATSNQGDPGESRKTPKSSSKQNQTMESVIRQTCDAGVLPKSEPINDTPLPPPYEMSVDGRLGKSVIRIHLVKTFKKNFEIGIDYTFADGSSKSEKLKVRNLEEAKVLATVEVTRWEETQNLQLDPSSSVEAVTCGDTVIALKGKHKGKVMTVAISDSSGIWLKPDMRGFSPAIGPFEADQIKKM